MEGVIGLLFILLLLLLAMTPVIILLGALGLAFESILAMIPFALKYFLPPALLGLAVARIRDKERMDDLRDYMPFAGGFIAAAAVLMLVVLNLPAHPTLPEADQVISITASYTEYGDETVTETSTDEALIRSLCERLKNREYTLSLKEFSKAEEPEKQYTVIFTEADGESISLLFCNKRTIAVQKGIFTFYYKTDKDSAVPLSDVVEIFNSAERLRNTKAWETFTDTFFDSFRFVWSEEQPNNGYLSFKIPETIPDTAYDIRIYMNGMDGYTGGEYTPQPFYIYEDEQHKDQWEREKTYEFWVTGTCYDRFEIVVSAAHNFERTLDILPLLPEECVKSDFPAP